MGKVKKKRPQKGDKIKKEKVVPNKEQPLENEPEQTFDFGGLPARDLKKNLGCG